MKRVPLTDYDVENELKTWIFEIWDKNVFLSDSIIQEKARRLSYSRKNQSPPQRKYGNMYSNGWLYSFKKRNHFKCYKSHGEAGDADVNAAERELPVLRSLIEQYGERNVFNADEFGLNYRPLLT